MLNLILTILLFSCGDHANKNQHIESKESTNQSRSYSDTTKNDSSYVFTGFYFLADEGQGIKMQKDHSNEVYNISKESFVSNKNILRANAQKNIVQGHETYGVTIVLDNQGTKDLEQGTGNSSYPYLAIVIANRLLYVVENTSKIKTGIMQVILVDYTEREVNDMIDAINQKK